MQMTSVQDIVILFAGRFPSEKAASLFVDLNARSLVEVGARVTVVVPRRLGRASLIQTPYRVVHIPTLDVSRMPLLGSVSNYISVGFFSIFSTLWLLFSTGRTVVVISNEAFPLLAATLVRKNTMYEMHDYADRSLWMYRTLFHRAKWILVTNEWKRKKLILEFRVREEKIMLERNAVDTSAFGSVEKSDARKVLGIPQDAKLAVYTGHLYEWKGAGTLAEAAIHLPDVTFAFVGGTEADVANFKKEWGNTPNIQIVGYVPHDQIPLWQAAADVLVLPNSAKEDISVHYTSPMKLFEYMASNRAIVASDLPSIREIVPPDAAYFAGPDNPESFAEMITKALNDDRSAARSDRAREIVADFTWQRRASRILQRVQ
jgi:glycosyltransferase involved in cell wall biosynthesis